MRSILVAGEATPSRTYIQDLLSDYFGCADVKAVASNEASKILKSHSRQRLIVYLPSGPTRQTMHTLATIRSLSSQTPLLVYGDFDRMSSSLLGLLNLGVRGLLSVNSLRAEQIKAFDTLMRGDSYIDETVRIQLVTNLLRRKNI